MRREVRIRYRTRVHPRPWVHWSHEDINELAPGELLRLLGELAVDNEVAVAWIEYRDVTEWTRSGGAELFHTKTKDSDVMTIAAYLTPDQHQVYLELQKAGRLDVLASDPNGPGETRHAVQFEDGKQKVLYTSELVQLIENNLGEKAP